MKSSNTLHAHKPEPSPSKGQVGDRPDNGSQKQPRRRPDLGCTAGQPAQAHTPDGPRPRALKTARLPAAPRLIEKPLQPCGTPSHGAYPQERR